MGSGVGREGGWGNFRSMNVLNRTCLEDLNPHGLEAVKKEPPAQLRDEFVPANHLHCCGEPFLSPRLSDKNDFIVQLIKLD